MDNRDNHAALAGTRVMVIDDSNTIRRCAEIFLRQAGCEVILAANGFEALAQIEEQRPDVIFIDILMPRLDGYQTCALLKSSARHRTTPVVLLSSKDTAFDRARGRLAGSCDHLAKPFSKETLLRTVELCSGRERGCDERVEVRGVHPGGRARVLGVLEAQHVVACG